MPSSLTEIKTHLHQLEKKYHRIENSVHLLAASKQQSVEKILALYESGQHVFGENYLQEALEKMSALADKHIEWHFIGSIQRNKTRKIAEHFSWVQTVSDETIAKRLNEQRPAHLPPLNICIEVNISEEKSKSGIVPEEVHSLANYCITLPHLKLRGLMCIPEPHSDLHEQRAIFKKMFELHQRLQQNFTLDTLSMGMSNDMEAAIAEGATLLRLGTALFGPRID